jgi:hypothetical protein
MFKKIHSNRDPRDTLFSELRKEFSVYIEKGAGVCKRIVCNHPRTIFCAMIFLLLASTIATIIFHSLFFQPGKNRKAAIPIARPVNDGFDQILKTSAALKETIRLKKQVDSITAKKLLSKADSIELLNDLDSLQRIRITINNKQP